MPSLRVGRDALCVVVLACAAVAAADGPAPPTGSWSDLAGGVSGGFGSGVRALAVFDDGWGDGPVLYAAGQFATAGGAPAKSIARWDGRSWSDVGGLSATEGGEAPGLVAAMVVVPGPAGDLLVVAGSFQSAGGVAAVNVAGWNGRTWSPLGAGLGGQGLGMPTDLAVLTEVDPNTGRHTAHLHAAGTFKVSGDAWFGPGVARFADGDWIPVGPPLTTASSFALLPTLCFHDDGAGVGPQLHVGGASLTSNGVPVGPLARLDRDAWVPVDGIQPATGVVLSVRSHPIDGVSSLLVGGTMALVGAADRDGVIVRRNGTWSALGRGVRGSNSVNVGAIALVDDGVGDGRGGSAGDAAVYVGGSFALAGGTPAANVARWNGTFWTEPAGGVGNQPTTDGASDGASMDALNLVPAGPLAMVRDPFAGPDAPRIIVAGGFKYAGDVLVNGIAAWTPPDVVRPGPFPHRCAYGIEPIPAPSSNVLALTNGDVAAGYQGDTAFVVSGGVLSTITAPPPASGVRILDVNDANVAVGSLEYGPNGLGPSSQRGFRLDLASGEWTIFNLDQPACNGCKATAVGNDGIVYGFFQDTMYTWVDGVQSFPPVGPGVWMDPKGANGSGHAVGMWNDVKAGLNLPARFDGATIEGLPLPPIDLRWGGFARRINDAGTIIGFIGNAGLVWEDGIVSVLTGIDRDAADPADINNAGLIVGTSLAGARPALWQSGAVTSLRSLTSWRDQRRVGSPSRVNDAGTIAVSWSPRPFATEGPVALLRPHAPPMGDVDGDCRVDGYDLGLVLVEFGWSDSPADLDGDGVVDGLDLGLVLGGWTG